MSRSTAPTCALDAPSLGDWLAAATDAAGEVAVGLLGVEHLRVGPGGAIHPSGSSGAYVPLFTDGYALHVGLVSSDPGCVSLAAIMLGLGGQTEGPSPEDVADAVGELANMLAGVMKRQFEGRIESCNVGLPVFVRGEVVTEGLDSVVARVGLDDVEAEIVVLRGKSAPSGSKLGAWARRN